MRVSSYPPFPAIILMGPTAVGKSLFALELAKVLPVEVISVDSAMVYRSMDIGTGKPSHEDLTQVPHHLIDIRDPKDAYSAAEFAKDALQHMRAITKRNRIPLLVGGTFLYFRALQQGLSSLPSADPTIRAQLESEAKILGWPALHAKLAFIDSSAASRIHPNDAQRIQRALEVYAVSQRPMSSFFRSFEPPHPPFGHPLPQGGEGNNKQEFQWISFALMPENRAVLHQKIEQRFYQMLEQGFVTEVEGLFKRKDLNPNLPSMRAVGYRQVWQYLAGECLYKEMISQALAATRQLAKRQLTWLRSLSDYYCLENTGLASLKSVLHCLSERGITWQSQ